MQLRLLGVVQQLRSADSPANCGDLEADDAIPPAPETQLSVYVGKITLLADVERTRVWDDPPVRD